MQKRLCRWLPSAVTTGPSSLCSQAALQKASAERRVQEAILNVAVGNAPALRLYRRLGFVDGALVPDYYGPVR